MDVSQVPATVVLGPIHRERRPELSRRFVFRAYRATRTPVTTAVLPKRWTFTSSERNLITASELNSASNAVGFKT